MSHYPTPDPVRVSLGNRSYDVIIGDSILGDVGTLCRDLKLGSSCAVISDSNVAPLFGGSVHASLSSAGFTPVPVTVPAGESSKSMEMAEFCCREMIRAGLDRGSFVVALGGGVVGDLAGFVASIFFRGIPFVQIPTTIVSQVDSSVGGKTGVNAPEGKNLIGSFHQPRLVVADVATLSSLPLRERNEGFAEVIKHAAIREGAMFAPILRAADPSRPLDPELIRDNIAIKARIVEEDEREVSGVRALLNFGHTIGHAIEASAGYGALLHGEAISLGIVAAVRLSQDHAGLPAPDAARIVGALGAFHLPQSLPSDIPSTKIMERLARDKKFQNGAIRFVLLRSIGDAFVSEDITQAHILDAVDSLR